MNNTIRLAGLAVIMSFVFAACSSNNAGGPKGPPPQQVAAYEAKLGAAVYYDAYPATVTAINQVEVRSEVSGYVTDIYFKDGQHINKGMKFTR